MTQTVLARGSETPVSSTTAEEDAFGLILATIDNHPVVKGDTWTLAEVALNYGKESFPEVYARLKESAPKVDYGCMKGKKRCNVLTLLESQISKVARIAENHESSPGCWVRTT